MEKIDSNFMLNLNSLPTDLPCFVRAPGGMPDHHMQFSATSGFYYLRITLSKDSHLMVTPKAQTKLDFAIANWCYCDKVPLLENHVAKKRPTAAHGLILAQQKCMCMTKLFKGTYALGLQHCNLAWIFRSLQARDLRA